MIATARRSVFWSRAYLVLFATVALAYISACASLGIVGPQTYAERVAYAAASVAAVQDATTSALTAKQISIAEAQQVRTITYNARELLKAGDALYTAGNATAANARLDAVQGLLKQLQQYLAKATAAPPPAPPADMIH
jgi:hypothetical protein